MKDAPWVRYRNSRGHALAAQARRIRDPRERARAWAVAADAFLEEGLSGSAADALIRATEARAVHSCRWGKFCPILRLSQAVAIAQIDPRIISGRNAGAIHSLWMLTHQPRGRPRVESLEEFLYLLQDEAARLAARQPRTRESSRT